MNSAPDLSDPRERALLRGALRNFTDTPHTLSYDAREFWLDELELWAKVRSSPFSNSFRLTIESGGGMQDQAYNAELLNHHRSYYDILCSFLDTNTHNRCSLFPSQEGWGG